MTTMRNNRTRWIFECGPGGSRVAAFLVLAIVLLAARVHAGSDVIAIRADRVYTVTGAPLDGGVVLIENGRIVAVGPDIAIPDGARVIERSGATVTPGLIDACCVIHPHLTQLGWTDSYGNANTETFWDWIAEQESHEPNEPSNVEATRPHADLCPHPNHGPPAGPGALAVEDDGPPVTWGEHSSEVTPHLRVFDAVNLFSRDFDRLAREGVTTVFVSPDSSAVIGARGAIVKTAGPLARRVVRKEDAVKAALGSDPSVRGRSNDLPPYYGPDPTFHTRRPTTRMGVDWVFRKAFYVARDGLPMTGADAPPAEAVPILRQVLAGEVPLRIQARQQHDIFAALKLAGQFGLRFILEEATEAYRCLPQLQAANVPVIYGPIFMEPQGWRGSYAVASETRRPRLNGAKQIADAGLTFALTARELRGEQGLVRQGMFAARNGLSVDAALRAMTQTPAELMGLADDVGSVAVGKRADLVVWSGEPLAATSRPLYVLVDGQVVYEPE